MSKTICFSANTKLVDGIDKYCEDHGGMSVSSFLKNTVAAKLIKENYLSGGDSQ